MVAGVLSLWGGGRVKRAKAGGHMHSMFTSTVDTEYQEVIRCCTLPWPIDAVHQEQLTNADTLQHSNRKSNRRTTCNVVRIK